MGRAESGGEVMREVLRQLEEVKTALLVQYILYHHKHRRSRIWKKILLTPDCQPSFENKQTKVHVLYCADFYFDFYIPSKYMVAVCVIISINNKM